MARTVKSWLQLSLKLVNSTIGVTGIAMILYSIWMVRAWQLDMDGSSSDHPKFSLPWFIHAFLGIGIALCGITCLGHIAAHTANRRCLSCYMVVIFFLLLVEIALITDISLNSHWEKDFPEDPSGRFDDFDHFVKSNFDTCKWIGWLLVLAQGCSVILAAVLRATEKDQGRKYDNEDDYAPQRLPFLGYPVQPFPGTIVDFPLALQQ
ncbi:tetraspanin-19-like isoform X2 [Rhododendron vialii]|uniref:tetraspanin-19-like isoform X2 n=1 Tax=Rhododendron vialii TaxID=182163 RepID=UPI00265F8B1E|nr:tetraspanin-19-like isoform X2 [Rhododendron vialii]